MKISRFYKVLFAVASLLLVGNIHSYATEEVTSESQMDTVPPVFASNIQTRYVIQGVKDGSEFVPQNVITGITATDDVDGTDVAIEVAENCVDLTRDGQYYVAYTATDKAGNTSMLFITVIVDKTAPIFDENIEKEYHINGKGVIMDSNFNIVQSLPETLVATDSVGAYEGIGVYMNDDEKGNIVFLGTIEDSPAVGVIQPNDILIAVNGEDVRAQSSFEAAKKIKGAEGNSVELKIIRNEQEMTVTLERRVVKLYADEEFEAKPNVEITSIDTKSNGVIEITYTATDEAGNSSEFVVTVVVDLEEPEPYIDEKKTDEEEGLYMVTTGDNPPEETDLELPEEIVTDEELTEQEEEEITTENEALEEEVSEESAQEENEAESAEEQEAQPEETEEQEEEGENS